MRISLLLIFLPLTGIFLTACRKDRTFSEIPSIEFRNLSIGGDSSKLVLFFTDGDGDIGLAQFDTAGTYRFNCFVDVYRKTGNEWIKQDFIIPYYYRIPVLKKSSKNKPLEGDIHIDLLDFPPDLGTPEKDTLKASIYILDRALNKSNVVESPEFITGF